MMKKLNFVLFLYVFVLIGCSDDENTNITSIPISDYSLMNSSCQWIVETEKDMQNNTVFVINSKSQLEEHLVCEDEAPYIDFTNNTLLLVLGRSTSGITRIDKSLEKNNNRYSFKINIIKNLTTEAPRWGVAIIAPKMDKSAEVKLQINEL